LQPAFSLLPPEIVAVEAYITSVVIGVQTNLETADYASWSKIEAVSPPQKAPDGGEMA
jgi:hypothetical protein